MARLKRPSHDGDSRGRPGIEREIEDESVVFELQHIGRRRRGPHALVWLAVAVSVIAVAGFFGRVFEFIHTDATAAPAAAIAWVDATPAPTPEPTVHSEHVYNVGVCFGPGLGATERWIDVDSWPTAAVIIQNKNSLPCYLLAAPPAVTLSYEDGEAHEVDGYGVYSTLMLAPNEKMAVRLRFDDICRTFEQSTVQARITIGNGSDWINLPKPPGYDTRCGSYPPGPPGKVFVGPYERWPAEEPADLPDIRVSVASFRPWVSPGERVHYLIELMNISGHRIMLDECPTYRQYILGRATHAPAVYRLNCDAIGAWLEPNQVWRLEMYFDVPPETTSGAGTLVWEAASVVAGQARTQIVVSAP